MNRILGAVKRRNTPANRRRGLWALAAVPAWAAGGAAGMFLGVFGSMFIETELGFKPPARAARRHGRDVPRGS